MRAGLHLSVVSLLGLPSCYLGIQGELCHVIGICWIQGRVSHEMAVRSNVCRVMSIVMAGRPLMCKVVPVVMPEEYFDMQPLPPLKWPRGS